MTTLREKLLLRHKERIEGKRTEDDILNLPQTECETKWTCKGDWYRELKVLDDERKEIENQAVAIKATSAIDLWGRDIGPASECGHANRGNWPGRTYSGYDGDLEQPAER